MNFISQSGFIEQIKKEDREIWSFQVCGLACIAGITDEKPQKILDWFIENKGWSSVYGWKHMQIIQFLQLKGWKVKRISYHIFSIKRLIFLLSKKNGYFMASINSKEGSHLVTLEYKSDREGFIIYDPGTQYYPEGSQQNYDKDFFSSVWRKYGIYIYK